MKKLSQQLGAKVFKFLFGLALLIGIFFLPNNSYAKYSNGFDFPLGAPDGDGYAVRGTGGLNWLERYDYVGDGIAEFHPGEDWNEARNGKDYGGDNRDYGDPIYAISEGVVKYANMHSAGWGNLVLIEHDLAGVNYWSQYGHMMKLAPGIIPGLRIAKGDVIGYVGAYPYNSGKNIHLHFETRKKFRQAYDFVPNWSRERVVEYYVEPTNFINAHRPVGAADITATAGSGGSSTINWTAPVGSEVEKYEVYRSEVPGACGTGNPIKSVSDSREVSFSDSNLVTGKTYYYCVLTYYKNGIFSKSAEQSVQIKQEIIKIVAEPTAQSHPTISDGRVFWEDLRSENNTWPKRLYYYDLATKKVESVSIGTDGAKRPYLPNSQGTKVVYYTDDSKGTGNNIYCYDFTTGNPYAITQAKGEQVNPVISESGIVVWQDLRNGSNYDLYYLDVTKSQGEIPFVTASGNQRNPAIWGNRVVWMDSRAGNRNDLYEKEIGGTERLLATNVGDDAPSIWDNYVVWQYKGKVSMVDVNSGALKTIAATAAGPSPKVRDGKIAYTLVEGTNSYIHVYEIATGKDTKIDFSLNYASFPFIFGNILVFDHAEKSTVPNMDIYLVYL